MGASIVVKVRSTEIDRMGHLNHAKYLEYMEWSRGEWLSDCHLSPRVLDAKGLGVAVVHVRIDYHREIHVDQRLQVTTHPLRTGRTSFTVKNEILDVQGECMSVAEVVSVLLDLKMRCAVPLLPELRAAFGSSDRVP